MSYYTVLSPQPLLVGSDPVSAAAQLLLPSLATGAPSVQVNSGDLVTVADPPVTVASYTQVTTANGTVGWLPTSALQQGMGGSTVMNVGIIAAIVLGIYFIWRKKA